MIALLKPIFSKFIEVLHSDKDVLEGCSRAQEKNVENYRFDIHQTAVHSHSYRNIPGNFIKIGFKIRFIELSKGS